LVLDDLGAISGAVVLRDGALQLIRAGAVVLASGGCGQLYANTTSPRACTGDGTAAALRSGAVLADLEFVQFHPTALHTSADPRPLISESMRGEGAVLRAANGDPVMDGVHPRGDLAPRDIVSRAMVARMINDGVDRLFLDATAIKLDLTLRFPTITAACQAIGIDPRREWIPVSPACHYTMGGVRTDLFGRTSLEGLFAIGETAATGVHGANRLASNSLVEGIVFGRRAAEVLTDSIRSPHGTVHLAGAADSGTQHTSDSLQYRSSIRKDMVQGAGVIRTRDGLAQLVRTLDDARPTVSSLTEDECATANIAQLAQLVATTASQREESRGAHFRSDFPQPVDSWQVHQHCYRNDEGYLCIDQSAVVDIATTTEISNVVSEGS
jgi:L-aspartate oxidase